MPRPKSDFETLYPYQLYTPEEILDPDMMYTLPEVARRMQNLAPDTQIDEESEARIIAWTIPWMVYHQESFVINDPEGDDPGYFGLRADAITDATDADAVDADTAGVDADDTDAADRP